jgi:hypothetical protein
MLQQHSQMEMYLSQMDSEMRLCRAFPVRGHQTLGIGRLLQRVVKTIFASRWKLQRGDPVDHLARCAGLLLQGQCSHASRPGTLEYAYLRLPIRLVGGLLLGPLRFEFLDTLRFERVSGLFTLAALQLLSLISVRNTQVGIIEIYILIK